MADMKMVAVQVSTMLQIGYSEGLTTEQIDEAARLAFIKALKEKRITFEHHQGFTEEEFELGFPLDDYTVTTRNGTVITAQYKRSMSRWIVYLGDCLMDSADTRLEALSKVDSMASRHND